VGLGLLVVGGRLCWVVVVCGLGCVLWVSADCVAGGEFQSSAVRAPPTASNSYLARPLSLLFESVDVFFGGGGLALSLYRLRSCSRKRPERSRDLQLKAEHFLLLFLSCFFFLRAAS